LSRRCAGILLLFVAAGLSTPAAAQTVSEEDRAVARGLMLRVGKLAPPARPRCEQPKGNDIVVCAQDQNQFRAQGSSGEDPTGKAGTNDGRLTPPDVAGNGIFKGKPTMGGMCLIPPCAAPKAYMVDLASIPEAPAGSDADRIAKGEIKAP